MEQLFVGFTYGNFGRILVRVVTKKQRWRETITKMQFGPFGSLNWRPLSEEDSGEYRKHLALAVFRRLRSSSLHLNGVLKISVDRGSGGSKLGYPP